MKAGLIQVFRVTSSCTLILLAAPIHVRQLHGNCACPDGNRGLFICTGLWRYLAAKAAGGYFQAFQSFEAETEQGLCNLVVLVVLYAKN